jgi:hypothetical protein
MPASGILTDREINLSEWRACDERSQRSAASGSEGHTVTELDWAGCRVLETSAFGLPNAIRGGTSLLIARSQESPSASSR